MQFVARIRVQRDGSELPVAVTAMRFDGSLRRLVTGFSDGCVRTFNFNNGDILREVGCRCMSGASHSVYLVNDTG